MGWESSPGVAWTSVSGELESEGPCVRSLAASSRAPRATLAGSFSWSSGVGLVENMGEAGRCREKPQGGELSLTVWLGRQLI